MTLEQRIRREIEATGPIPFEVFMEVPLYDPDGGFFTTGKLRSERGGDFLTSPEVSALFGETLARFVEQERERIGRPFEVVEVAAGSGSLIGPLMGAISVEVSAVEASPAARKALSAILDPDRIGGDLPDRIRGVVIANELIDNLRWRWRNGSKLAGGSGGSGSTAKGWRWSTPSPARKCSIGLPHMPAKCPRVGGSRCSSPRQPGCGKCCTVSRPARSSSSITGTPPRT